MFGPFRKCLCLTLACQLAAIPVAHAQNATMPSTAPLPAQVLSAHTVFVSNGGGSNYFEIFTGGPDRAYNTLYADLRNSGRYQLVGSPAQADLIFEIHAIAPAVGDVDEVGYNPQLVLSIRDPKTSTVLWTTRANVRAVGRQRSRDRYFDDCVAVLLDKFGQLTGQQLSPQQLKAIRNNSRTPTAVKVFIIASVVGGAAFAGWIIYRGTHPPPPPPPPQLP